jgi:3-oxoacyl-[acyl-carrier-protein] synthase II
MDNSVVITGAGLISSLGPGVSETWNNLLSGRHGMRRIQGFDPAGFDCHFAAQVSGLDPSVLNIHPRDARIMDKHSFMLMKCSHEAYRQARLDTGHVQGEDIGFFAGMGMVDYDVEDILPAVRKSAGPGAGLDYNAFFSHGYREIYPLWPLSMLNNISFCQVAISMNIRGENAVYSPHADSGMQAVVDASHTVIDKKAEVAVAGGVSEKVSPLSLARAQLHGVLYDGDIEHEMVCRPFSSERSGTVLGEGCGMLALELRSSADRRGVPYKVMIRGYGYSFGREGDSYSPTSEAIESAMDNAIRDARVKPSDIDALIVHGDGTRTGDKNEIEAVHTVFQSCVDRVAVFSSKGALGNLLAGAPAVDVILGMNMIENGIIPPAVHSSPAEMDIRFHLVTGDPLRKDLNLVMINALSYEGQCMSLIIGPAH